MSVAMVGAAASIAGPLISGMMAGDAAGDASDAQIQAAERASATQAAAREQQRKDLSPWMNTGVSANNALAYRLGLGGSASGGFQPQTREQLRNQLVGQFTKPKTKTNATWTPGTSGWEDLASQNDRTNQTGVYAPGGNGLLPNTPYNLGSWADGQSTEIDEAGLNAAIEAQWAEQERQRAEWEAKAGNDPLYGSLLRKFSQNDLDTDLVYQNTYKTALDTGLNAINSRAANSGGYGSGAALKALTRFGADTANTYTGGAYNRNMQEKGQTYNFLSGVSQQGQNAAAGVGAAGISTANNIAQNQLAAGNAQSAGIVGGANALSGGIADATNAFQWNQLMSKPKTRTDYGAGMNSYLYSNLGSGG